MDQSTEVTFPRSDFFNILSHNMAASGYNYENLTPDGTIGPNIRKAFWQFLVGDNDEDSVNLMICLFKAGGYNDALEPDGDAGEELVKAINLILEENGQKPFSEDELNNDQYVTPDE